MTAPDDLDGVAVVIAIAPASAALCAGASPWLALALAAGTVWGAAVVAGYLALAERRGPRDR